MRVVCLIGQRTAIATDRRSEPLVFDHHVATDSTSVTVCLFRLRPLDATRKAVAIFSWRWKVCATPHLCSTDCEIVRAVLRAFFFFTQSLQNIFPSFHPAQFHSSVVLSTVYATLYLLLERASGRVLFNRFAAVESRGQHLLFPSSLTHFLFYYVHAPV
jgi:hypothetical protein